MLCTRFIIQILHIIFHLIHSKNVSVDLCVIPNNIFANACYVLHTLDIVSNTLCMKYPDFNEQKHLSHIFGIILSNMKFRNIYALLNRKIIKCAIISTLRNKSK